MTRQIDFGEALQGPFREPGWPPKAAILGVLSLVPVLNFATVGYEVEVARRVALGEDPRLPDWSDLGALFRRGLPLALARYAYVLPFLILALLALTSGGAALLAINTRYEAWSPLLGAFCAGGVLLAGFLALLIGVINPAVTVRYLQEGTFASCFHLSAILRQFREHPAAHLSVFGWTLALSLGLSLLAAPAGAFLGFIPCIGTLATPLLYAAIFSVLILVMAHLEGQLLRVVGRAAT